MEKVIDYNLVFKNEYGDRYTYNEVALIALQAKDLKAMTRLLTYGKVYIDGVFFYY